ncbi:MAG: BamA/TamA family outer membrane protein [Proteobacteria bacterium]|nr:BamA/TamA family outer membrane protein [Pseudomonadota bacterium]
MNLDTALLAAITRKSALAVLVMCSAGPLERAFAQPSELPTEDADRARRSREAADDASFGPILIIEDIEIKGNESTAARVILRLLPIARGDILRAGDPRFQRARFKLLATGYFRAVELEPRRGSKRGHVILTVRVKERGTVILNRLYLGTSRATPWWAGIDGTERNAFGTGVSMGMGGVYASSGNAEDAQAQWALTLRIADPAIRGTPYGAHATALYTRASEPYRVRGEPSSGAADNFRAFSYSRLSLQAGLSIDLSPLSQLALDGRAEWVDADAPLAPTRERPDGTFEAVQIGLLSGQSRVVTVTLAFDHDTRPNPVLPFAGTRLVMIGELGATFVGGSYDFAIGLARYQHWWPVHGNRHVLSLHLTGGLVAGQAPQFNRLHTSDFNPLLTPRAFGLVVSTSPSPDIFGTGADDTSYGDFGASAVLEYSYRLFRERFHVYGGDLFVGAGLWGLADSRDFKVRDRPLHRAVPVGLIVNAGLRIDTEFGIFEFSFANALGRIPL